MIVKMKKLTILVSNRERDSFVSALRTAGVVHVRQVGEPAAHEVTFVEERIQNIDKAVDALLPYSRGKADTDAACPLRELMHLTQNVIDWAKEKKEIVFGRIEIEDKVRWFDPWGEFDPEDLERLNDKGVNIKLYRISKKDLRGIKNNIQFQIMKEEKGYVYIAVRGQEGSQEIPFEEIQPPEGSPGVLRDKIQKLDNRETEIDVLLKQTVSVLGCMKECRDELAKEQKFLNVRHGMQEEGTFSCLEGFCPEKSVKKITGMAEKHGLGYVIQDPDDPDETPTLITNPFWIRVVDPVFKFMNIIPGYSEFDISFVFMIFFSVFFAMLIGDAGYGLLFLVVTLLARIKMRKAPPEPFFLMYLLSGVTVVWGAVTGTWFGAETIAKLPGLDHLVIKNIDSFASGNQDFIIYICFIIGACHLTIAHLMRAGRMINSLRALAELGWIAIIWGMFFAAGKFVLAKDFPQMAGIAIAVGALMVLVFSNPGKNWIKGMGMTLANLPLSIISSFSDVVSYLRLFAVGYATVVLASTFNNMALGDGVRGFTAGLVAALILFFGHALNIILGMMAVIVHGIRLNMLEFSGHLGMQWTGKQYKPFCENGNKKL